VGDSLRGSSSRGTGGSGRSAGRIARGEGNREISRRECERAKGGGWPFLRRGSSSILENREKGNAKLLDRIGQGGAGKEKS